MPIKIPQNLPAYAILKQEGVMIMSEDRAERQDIRPLRIALLNLMPLKIKTETQIARLLGHSPLQVELTLIAPNDYIPKHTARAHMLDFYRPFDAVRTQFFDGLIITGAPIERLPFDGVSYWNEMQDIFQWSRTNVFGLFNLCWGAQAALYYFHGVSKHLLVQKCCGVYPHKVLMPEHLLVRGLDEEVLIPVSRYTETRVEEVASIEGMNVLMTTPDAGACLLYDARLNHVNMFNHLEYDLDTLEHEYRRDLCKGESVMPPYDYFADARCTKLLPHRWRASAHLLFGNWLNMIYQDTPYDLGDIPARRQQLMQ